MAIDTKSLSQLITEFREIQAKDAITPETVGSLLQRIADLLATAGSGDVIDDLADLLNGLKSADHAISSIAQGDGDRDNILLNQVAVNFSDGSSSRSDNIKFIRQATSTRAGAMTAEQVSDLRATKQKAADLESTVKIISAKLGLTDGTKGIINNAQISLYVLDDKLHILGAQQLIANGYVPYLFRRTRKRNKWNDKVELEKGAKPRKYCIRRKGWNLYGSVHTLKLFGDMVQISTSLKCYFSREANGYSDNPSFFVSTFTNKKGNPCVAWGRSSICLLDSKNKTKHRMIRLPFAIGFAKKINPSRTLISPANLVSSLAEFSLVYNPRSKKWYFSI